MSSPLPPFSWGEAATNWQFAPIVTAFSVIVVLLYLWGAFRVRKRHPRRPWPLWRTILFLLGVIVVNLAVQSGIGRYADTLFWVHMIQHLMLLMIAPPLLVGGTPLTLLLHASRNPLHTWAKRFLRSRPIQWITFPAFGVVAYVATIVGTHLTNFMNLVFEHVAVQDAEHVLFLVVGCIYFLPLVGREAIKWRVSYPLRLFLLFIAMPVDAFTGVVLGSYQTDPFVPMEPRSWGPSALNDLHEGGAVMWVGGAVLMFVMIMVTFLQWTREPRSSAAMGWLEGVRRTTMADRIAEVVPAAESDAARARGGPGSARPGGRPAGSHPGGRPAGAGGRRTDVDEDEDQLAAYNAYLSRINGARGRGADEADD